MGRPEKIRLGEILLQQNLLTEDQVKAALDEQKRSGRKLGRIFIDAGYVTEEQIGSALARQLQVPYINLKHFNIRPEVATRLPETLARRFRAIVLEDSGTIYRVGMADPVCRDLAGALETGARESGARVHRGGTYICIEGPQFSTRGESNVYRRWGMSVIGMTNMPEAKLAREAEICYATMAMVTDYDCWREGHDDVTVEQVIAVLHQNAENAAKVVKAAITTLPAERRCACGSALQHAVLTDRKAIPPETKERLGLLLNKYF